MSSPIDLTLIAGSAVFTPSNRQIRARNRFYDEHPGELPPDLSAAAYVEMGAPQALLKWWGTAGFSEWWSSPQWEKEESQRILYAAMQTVARILGDTDLPAQVQLGAAKEAREIYSKLNTTKEQRFADESIAEMDRKQLEEYIKRNTPQLLSK